MSSEITARVRKNLTEVAKLAGRMPLICIDDKDGYSLNGHAQKFISQRGMAVRDFMEWILMGSSHLKSLSYDGMTVHMMHLPSGDVIVLLKENEKKSDSALAVLTGKEKEVLRLVIKGFSNKEIAGSMTISPGTVKVHLDHIYNKLECTNRLEAALKGIKNGLFLPSASGT